MLAVVKAVKSMLSPLRTRKSYYVTMGVETAQDSEVLLVRVYTIVKCIRPRFFSGTAGIPGCGLQMKQHQGSIQHIQSVRIVACVEQ